MGFRLKQLTSIAALAIACSAPAVPIATPGTSEAPSTGDPAVPPTSSAPSPSTDVTEIQRPSTASLIQRAVAEGRLDAVTALEYRAMAMFGLPGLPDEYAGGVPRSDSAALKQIAAMMDDISEADRARLQPYLLRPTQPGSVFYESPVASVATGSIGQHGRVAAAPSTCRTWADSGNLDQRFKVWACADTDAAAAEIDIATIVVMIQSIWDSMSADMGGPPKPDAYGTNVSAEYGGDARIDFYALHMGQVVYRDGPNEIPVGAAAATSPAPPFTEPDGRPRKASSAFMLLNVDTLERDETTFKLDLIHEFFHALQLAHNYRATSQGTVEHWFVESTATWAETYYMREASDQPHGWIYRFQNERLGLQDPDLDHQYSSYVWPFFMEQDENAQAIFNAWKATDQIAARDFDAVTAAVDAQVKFETRFREFAVRNLNLNDVLRPANEARYDELDANFYDDVAPFVIIPSDVSPGSPYVSSDPTIPELTAFYYEPRFSEDARKVKIAIDLLQPSSQVDGDFLAHYTDNTWKRLRIENGKLEFCRDDPGWDIDRGYLVVSNHAMKGAVNGRIEIDGSEECQSDVIRLHGTFTGHSDTDPLSISDATFDLTVLWHNPSNVHEPLAFQFESGNFTFSTEVIGVCAGSLNEGANLEMYKDDVTYLLYGDPTEGKRYASAGVIDYRADGGGVSFSLVAYFTLPGNGDPSCEPPFEPYGYVPICPLVFTQLPPATQGGRPSLQANATCDDGVGTTWTGHLVEQ